MNSSSATRCSLFLTLVGGISLFFTSPVNGQGGLTITSLTPSQSYPLVGGTAVTWTATVTNASGPVEYKFYLYRRTAWVLMQDYGLSNTLTWTPQPGDEGTPNRLQVWARLVGSTAAYDAVYTTPDFEVLPAPVMLTANVDFPTPVGNTVMWTASTSQTISPEYEFRVLDQSTSIWTVFRAYATAAQAQWTPQANGTYIIEVRARAVGDTSEYQWAASSPTLTVASTTLTVASFATPTLFPAPTGAPITWTARAKGGQAGPLEYEFWRYSYQSGTWTNVQLYGTDNTFTWTPVSGDAGEYSLQVWVRNAGSTQPFDAWRSTEASFFLYAPPILTSISPSSEVIGGHVTLSGLNLGPSQGTSTITFNGTAATTTAWNNTSISTIVPPGTSSGPVVLNVNGYLSNPIEFTVSTTLNNVKVTVYQEPLTSSYHFRVINGSDKPIVGLQIGRDMTTGHCGLTTEPQGWSPEVGIPVESGTSPTGWTADAFATEESATLCLTYTADSSVNSWDIPVGGDLDGFSVTVAQSDDSYLNADVTVVFDDGSQLLSWLEAIDPPQ